MIAPRLSKSKRKLDAGYWMLDGNDGHSQPHGARAGRARLLPSRRPLQADGHLGVVRFNRSRLSESFALPLALTHPLRALLALARQQ